MASLAGRLPRYAGRSLRLSHLSPRTIPSRFPWYILDFGLIVSWDSPGATPPRTFSNTGLLSIVSMGAFALAVTGAPSLAIRRRVPSPDATLGQR